MLCLFNYTYRHKEYNR